LKTDDFEKLFGSLAEMSRRGMRASPDRV